MTGLYWQQVQSLGSASLRLGVCSGLMVDVSFGTLLLCDSPHLVESVFGISCRMQRSGMYAVVLLFVCWLFTKRKCVHFLQGHYSASLYLLGHAM